MSIERSINNMDMDLDALKIESKFSGDPSGVDEFLSQLELRLSLLPYADENVTFAAFAVNLKGHASSWLARYRKDALAMGRDDLLEFQTLINEFRETFGAPSNTFITWEDWTMLSQTGTVEEYSKKSWKLYHIVSQNLNLPDKAAACQYVSGLKPDIKKYVRALEPSNLTEAIGFANFKYGSRYDNLTNEEGSSKRYNNFGTTRTRSDEMEIDAIRTSRGHKKHQTGKKFDSAYCKRHDLCFRCHKPGHAMKDCHHRKPSSSSSRIY